MPIVNNKQKFITQLKEFTSVGSTTNIISNFDDNKILIEETEESGRGKIYLNIDSTIDDKHFFIKIEHKSNHTIGRKQNHNDGIVLKVDLEDKKIDVYLFELKKQLRFNHLEKAHLQLASAYKFIKYLDFEECFAVNYTFFICHQDNNLKKDFLDMKNEKNKFKKYIFESVYENKATIPIQIPFCKFKEMPFKQLKFDTNIDIKEI